MDHTGQYTFQHNYSTFIHSAVYRTLDLQQLAVKACSVRMHALPVTEPQKCYQGITRHV